MSRSTGLLRGFARTYSEDSGRLTAVVLLVAGAATIGLGMVDVWPWAAGAARADEVAAAWHLVPLAVGCAGVLLRRSRPIAALSIAVVALVGDALLGGSLAVMLVLFDGVYAVERFGSPAARGAVRFGTGVATVATALAGVLNGLELRVAAALTLQTAALLLIPIWWARDVRLRTELADAAQARADLEVARADQAERAQAAQRQAAVQAERSRMARELHDAVAGDVSALVIRAGAALAAPPGPGDRESLAAVRESGLHALGELRSMIDVLAADGAAEPVAPTLTADGAALLARSDATTDGAPAQLGPLPAAVDRAAFRILQEALVNAARHGLAGSAVARLRQDDGDLAIEVTNAVDPPAVRRPGMGLASMAERADAVGGALAIEETGSHWAVRARLPVTDGAARERA